jgi:hypothetical protein
MGKLQEVYDQTGRKVMVRSADMKEILELGGSMPENAETKQPVESAAGSGASETEIDTRCSFIKADGNRCAGKQVSGSAFCFIKTHK